MAANNRKKAARKRVRSDSLHAEGEKNRSGKKKQDATSPLRAVVATAAVPSAPIPIPPLLLTSASLPTAVPSPDLSSLVIASAPGTPERDQTQKQHRRRRSPRRAKSPTPGSSPVSASAPNPVALWAAFTPPTESATHSHTAATTLAKSVPSPSPFITLKKAPATRPSIKYNLPELKKPLSVGDIRDLILWCLHEDGTNPRYAMVQNRAYISKVVAVNVPGLDPTLLIKNIERTDPAAACPFQICNDVSGLLLPASPSSMNHVQHPAPDQLEPAAAALSEIFPYILPVKGPGDRNRLTSPLASLIMVPFTAQERKMRQKRKQATIDSIAKSGGFPVTNLLLTRDDLVAHQYPLHPVHRLPNDPLPPRWVATSVIPGTVPDQTERKLLAMDCEMCYTQHGLELTRISLVDESGAAVMDEFVLPDDPILDYNTRYSGITAKHMLDVKTRVEDVQARLLELIDGQTILAGHSLENDLNALRLTHPFIIDTAVCYSNPAGAYNKPKLSKLADSFLKRQIQANPDQLGHDSIEDALACMDLVKLKLARGPEYGQPQPDSEPLMQRLRSSTRPRRSAWVDTHRMCMREGMTADVQLVAHTDDQVVNNVQHALQEGSTDFVFARLRDIERYYSSFSPAMSALPPSPRPAISPESVPVAVPVLPPPSPPVAVEEEGPLQFEFDDAADAFTGFSTSPPSPPALALSPPPPPPVASISVSPPPTFPASPPKKVVTIRAPPGLPPRPVRPVTPATAPACPPPASPVRPTTPSTLDIGAATQRVADRVRAIWDTMPAGSVMVVFSANNDTAPVGHVQQERVRGKQAGAWTDEQQAALVRIVAAAKVGCALVAVKD
ncbi:hypothetical protein GGF31_007275 [Allomyces arbusculus]|nr:hypothetical protein GGF31_007275 [Allomyces arbusculus]